MRPTLPRLGLAALVAVGVGTAAEAGGRSFHGGHHVGGYHHHGGSHRHVAFRGYAGAPYAYGNGGFADAAISGDYIGAPLTRFPRPNEIVPPAWGYGTYGVPTVTGIRQAPTAQPTLYVIDSPAPARAGFARGSARSRVLSKGRDGGWTQAEGGASGETTAGAARVISVTVPRR